MSELGGAGSAALPARREVAFVGADGALGSFLAPALGARAVGLRCPDLSDETPLQEVTDVDVVINAAGPRVHPGLGWTDYLREHVGTASRVARSMRPGSHLVLIGSAAVYGARRGAVSAETPPQPDSFPSPAYAWAKLSAEHASRAICAERGVALTVLRPSIVYGPGAGGVLIRLRDLARRGLRVVLDPPSARQHLLHLRLFEDVLRALIERPGPRAALTYVVADPFFVTTADLNAALAAGSPRAMPLRAPVALVARATRNWQRRSDVAVPGPAAVAAMLTLDNVYDAHTVLSTLGLDPAAYGQDKFHAFLRT